MSEIDANTASANVAVAEDDAQDPKDMDQAEMLAS